MDKIPLKNWVLVGGALNLIALIFALISQNRLPPQVPLFYGVPAGENQLVKPLFLTVPALLSCFLILVNLFLARLTHNDFLKKALVVAGLAGAIFAGITTFKIIFLVW